MQWGRAHSIPGSNWMDQEEAPTTQSHAGLSISTLLRGLQYYPWCDTDHSLCPSKCWSSDKHNSNASWQRSWMAHSPLHSTSSINRPGHESHVSAFPLRNILTIAQGELFTQLAGGHYFLYPILNNEQQRCEQALQDFAFNLWDYLHSIRVNLLQYPDDLLTPGRSSASVAHISSLAATTSAAKLLNRRLQQITEPVYISHTQSTISMLQPDNQQSNSGTSDEDTSPQVTFSEPTIRHCYGTDPEDLIRLSMGNLTHDQQASISKLHQLSTKEMFIETLCQTFQEDAQYRLHAWRKKDYSLWNPAGGGILFCSVYLMAPVDGTRLPTSIGGHEDFHYLTSLTKGSANLELISLRKLQDIL